MVRKALFPLVMIVIGFACGAGAGLYLKAPTDAESTEIEDDAGSDTAESAAPENVEYARLNNQFVVPVVRDAEIGALVVMSVTLEVDIGGTPDVFAVEPRLRDVFLQVMFDHANAGGFDGAFTEGGTMAILKRGLYEASAGILGDLVHDVLITDIVRQEV
jgi:hypothetical protein